MIVAIFNEDILAVVTAVLDMINNTWYERNLTHSWM
jgi:hypothetical protein